MFFTEGFLLVWILATAVPLFAALGCGLVKIWYTARLKAGDAYKAATPLVEVLIPVKGISADQEASLRSLLDQDYPHYRVALIVESEQDSANAIVDRLCGRYPHARKIVSGLSVTCAQKNHNLVEGVRSIEPQTDIIVFCDSTNVAPRNWLTLFTGPLRCGQVVACTTFRRFQPQPQTVGGVCQAIYAVAILLLSSFRPKPWGGATAILRKTFDDLGVVEQWSKTVIDDLVLGNILDKAGIKLFMDSRNTMNSPLKNQTVSQFLSYLDRQILFPKFTNPGMWLGAVVIELSLTLATVVTAVLGLLFPFGLVGWGPAWVSYQFLIALTVMAIALHAISGSGISLRKWLLCFLPFLLLSGFVFLRSIFLNHIDWHGRRYRVGRGGVVSWNGFLTGGGRVRS